MTISEVPLQNRKSRSRPRGMRMCIDTPSFFIQIAQTICAGFCYIKRKASHFLNLCSQIIVSSIFLIIFTHLLPVTFWCGFVGVWVRKNKLSFVIIVIFVVACRWLPYDGYSENVLQNEILLIKLGLLWH